MPLRPLAAAAAAALLAAAGPAGAAHEDGAPLARVSLSVSPSAVVGGSTATAIVTLEQPAGASGLTLDVVNGNTLAATMPAQVTFAPNALTAQFTITARPVSTNTAVQITVGAQQSVPGVATLTVRPPSIVSVTTATPVVPGGTTIPAVVTLDGPAPAGYFVSFTSSSTSLTPPPQTAVPRNATTLAVSLETTVVPSHTNVTVTARRLASLQHASLIVVLQALSVSDVTFANPVVRAGYPTIATIRLNAPAPAGGYTVNLTATGPALLDAPSVIVPANTTVQSVPVRTQCCAQANVEVTARGISGSPASASLIVRDIQVASINVTPAFQLHGQPFTVTVTLDTLLPPVATGSPVPNAFPFYITADGGVLGGFSVNVPTSGATGSGSFVLNTVSAVRTVTWRPDRGVARATTEVAPPEVTAFTLGAASAVGGVPLAGNRVTLAAVPPSPGVNVILAAAPGTVTAATPAIVRTGSSSATFDLVFPPVAQPTTVTVSVRSHDRPGAVERTATLTVRPPSVTTLTLPSSMDMNTSATGTVALNGPAPPGGAVVTLSSTSGVLSVPASVTVPAGAPSVQFTVSASNRQVRLITITARYGDSSVSRTLSVN